MTLAGRPLPLIAMEYRLLAELSANAGRLLTYEHLLERVWGEKSSDDVRPMRTIVSKLRRKLGDDADNPTYIFTEPRVGYRMPQGRDAESGGGVTVLKAGDGATATLLAFVRPVTPQYLGQGSR